MDILTQVDQLKAEIDALRPIDPAQERQVMQKFRLEWTYHSNAIEGNTLTFGETKAFLLHGITAAGRPFRDYVEMRGHHQAIDALLAIIRQQEPLTESTIRELHKIILVEPYDMPAQTASGQRVTRRITPGNYKTMPNHVQTSTGEMHYYASPEETPARMAELLAWYRQADFHPLIVAATFHYRFVEIHPFDDGNGRLARLLMNLILMQDRFPPLVIRTDTKESYLLALEQADTDDDLKPFINLIGDSLIKSMELYLRGARGESIEELDDLDKKVALLKRKLRGMKIEKTQKQAQIKIWLDDFREYVVIPFFAKLSPQLAKFSGLFTTTASDPPFDVFLERIGKRINTEKQYKLGYQWIGLTEDSDYAIEMIITIRLTDEEFIIDCITQHNLSRSDYDIFERDSNRSLNEIEEFRTGELLRHSYGHIPTEQELKTAVITITNDIYQLIEQKIDSTD